MLEDTNPWPTVLTLRPHVDPKELWDTCVLTKQTNDVYMVPETRTDPDTVLTRVVMQDVWLHPYSTRTTNKTYTMWEQGGGEWVVGLLPLSTSVPATSVL